MDRASEHPHDYRPSILSFLQLNVKKVANDLKLAERGKQRGEKNEPISEGQAFDDVENEVIELIEGEVKKAHQALLDDLSTYAQRLHALDIEGRFATIEAAAMDGISSFRSEVSRGIDRLSSPGQRVRELEQEMQDFKKVGHLKRTAHYPTKPGQILRWGVIAVLFLLEVTGNSYFLAKGSAYGLIGGFIEALIIAFLNIGVSLAFGFYGLRQLWHRVFWRKMIGAISFAGWLLFTIGFNLFVAHYREALGVFLDGGGAVALQALQANPFGLTDFQSWVLFGIGALFAFIALVDALSMDDLYPFYGKLDRRLEGARAHYADERSALIDELEEIKSETVDAMQMAKNDLSKRRGEHGSILENRTRAQRAYAQHIAYLERAGNALLSKYREANQEAREDDGPARFKEAWTLTRPPVEAGPPSDILPQDKLAEAVERAQASLDERMREVHTEYERAFHSYRRLDDLSGEKNAQASTPA